jgi:hypothetical protein
MTKLDEHFIKIDACETGRAWVAANCTTAQQCWELLAKGKRIDWMLWWLSTDGGAPAAAELARRWALRAARVHAANACEKSGILDHAATLRALPDDATCEQIEAAARAAWAAAWAAGAAGASAVAAARAAGASAGASAELDQQIADLLTLQPSAPWTEN